MTLVSGNILVYYGNINYC